MDFDSALHRFDGDREFMMEMCREFIDHLPGRMVDLHSAMNSGDINSLGRQAHNLKGIALNFSAEPLADLAADLEEQGRREDLTRVPALIAGLEAEAQRLRDYVLSRLT
jgi:HPt (histidine-containing phosphotransfer) domain-containing protein